MFDPQAHCFFYPSILLHIRGIPLLKAASLIAGKKTIFFALAIMKSHMFCSGYRILGIPGLTQLLLIIHTRKNVGYDTGEMTGVLPPIAVNSCALQAIRKLEVN